MKLLYVNYAAAVWGGVERVSSDKMNYFTKHFGYDVFLLTANQGSHSLPFKLDERIHFEDMNIQSQRQYRYRGIRRYWMRYRFNQLLMKRLSEKILQIKPDIIISNASGYISELIRLKGYIPLIAESHSGFEHVLEYDDMTWRRRLETQFRYKKLQRTDVLVTLTESDAQKWRNVHPHVKVIPNVVHLNDSARYSTCENKRVIFAGRFCKQKAIPDLLKVWSIVHERYPDWQLDMYVEGDNKDGLMQQIHALNAHINLYPPVSDIMNRFIDSSLMVLTSLYEPFGLVIAEAMSCGLPVVSFEGDGPSSIITDGHDGFVVGNRSIEQMADRICSLIENQQLRQRMGQNAIRTSQQYAADRIMPMWKELFESLTKL